jgi:hypothetical protein
LAGVFTRVYGGKWKNVKSKKKKKGRQNVLGREFVEVGLRPKKGRQIFWPPPFQISKYATAKSTQDVFHGITTQTRTLRLHCFQQFSQRQTNIDACFCIMMKLATTFSSSSNVPTSAK